MYIFWYSDDIIMLMEKMDTSVKFNTADHADEYTLNNQLQV